MMEYNQQDRQDSIPAIFTEAWNRRDAKKIASLFDEEAQVQEWPLQSNS